MSKKIATYVAVKATDINTGLPLRYAVNWCDRTAPAGDTEVLYCKPELMFDFNLEGIVEYTRYSSGYLLPLTVDHFKGVACTYETSEGCPTKELSVYHRLFEKPRIEFYTVVFDIGVVDAAAMMAESARVSGSVSGGFGKFVFATPEEFKAISIKCTRFHLSGPYIASGIEAFPHIDTVSRLLRPANGSITKAAQSFSRVRV